MDYGYDDEDFDPELEMTPEEKALLKRMEEGSGFSGGLGGLIGGGLGTAAGIGASIATGGAAAPLIPLISGLGSSLGGFVGTNIGADQANKAGERFEELRRKRLKPLQDRQRDASRTNELLGSWLSTRGF